MYSLAPDDLVQLVSPYLFAERFYQSPGAGGNTHELGSYAGAGCLALLVWLAARFRGLGERRRIVVGLLLVAWAGLDLSLGPHGLLYSIQVQIPLVGLFRAPARNILIVHLVLAGLAALAFDELSARQQRGERGSARGLWILTVPTLVAVAAAAVATAGFTRWNAQLAAPAWVWAGPLLAASAGVLVFAAARGRRWALPALMAFVAADQGFYGLSYAVEEPPVSYEEYRRRPAPLPPPDPRYRIHGGTTRFEEHTPNIFALWGYRLINSYSGASARTYLDYRNAKPLRIAGVSWIYRNDREERTVQYLSDPLPRARLVGRVVVTSDPMSALESIDVATTAVVEERLGLEPGVPGRAVLVEDRPCLISVETSAASRQLLIVSERNLGGWVARVDGVPARVVRVYGDFLGCVVESGQHQVTFDLDPPSLRLGRNISLAALFAAISLYTILFARLRRRPAPVTPAGAGAPGAP
ncbi:MAG: hypothetical protein O7A09_02795, partial [Proteobacteria bacterium]|nr:hypothetical protein [Pseudomonadota bacterium]